MSLENQIPEMLAGSQRVTPRCTRKWLQHIIRLMLDQTLLLMSWQLQRLLCVKQVGAWEENIPYGTQQETSPRKQLKGWDFTNLSNTGIIEQKGRLFGFLTPHGFLSVKDKIQSTFSFRSPKRRLHLLLWQMF